MKNLTYFVLLEGWIMPFNHKPEKINFKKGARLFVAESQTQIDYLPDWFGKGWNHSRFAEIKNW